MSNQDSPTPPAPAEVRERLKRIEISVVEGYDYDCGLTCREKAETIASAIALISQGEKERERLDWLESTRRALFTRDSSGIVKFDAETSATDWHCVNAPTFRQAIDAARAQPTPESK